MFPRRIPNKTTWINPKFHKTPGIQALAVGADLVSALQLGLRHHFGGSAYAIDHLQTTVSQEPVPDSSLRKQYLVLFDTVPGGTGFLKQLMRSETMLTVMDKALETLNKCSCQQDPGKDGCYNCLLAFRNSYSMPTTSRQTAMNMLSTILASRDTLRQVPNLQNIRVDGLGESELEVLFLEGLQRLQRQGWAVDLRKEVIRGKPGNFLRIGDQAYELEPQVELGQADGVIVPSRADFVIWPARSRQEGKPVAIFTDGLSFHRTRMGQDMAQRMALIHSGRFHVWSLTWKDVHAQVANKPDRVADLLHPGDSCLGRRNFVQLLSKLDHGLIGNLESEPIQLFVFASKAALQNSDPHFDHIRDRHLTQLGVPQELLPRVKEIATQQDLDYMLDALPQEAYEALFFLAEGFSVEEVFQEMDKTSTPQEVDTSDIRTALDKAETKQRFYVVTNDLELQAMH